MDYGNNREVFSQACQMVRFYIGLRQYVYAIGGAITAGLITLYFQRGALTPDAGFIIKVAGVSISLAAGYFEYRLTILVGYWHSRMRDASRAIGAYRFGDTNEESGWRRWLPTVAIWLVCIIASIAWIFYAKLPPPIKDTDPQAPIRQAQ